MNILFKRRSIRRFTTAPVSPEHLRMLLEAGMMAPSAGNQQAWQFVVVTKREMLDALAAVNTSFHPLNGAQAAIVVCGDLERETRKGFWVQDCAAVTQNILLQATGLGLGSVWCGVYPREERVAGVSQLLRLPVYAIPLSLIALGWPGEEKPTPVRWDEEKVHYEQWGNE